MRDRLETFLREQAGGDARVTSVEPLGGGACQENFRVDAFLEGRDQRLVLRSDAASLLPGSLDRRAEMAVVTAAIAAGARTPRARLLAQGLVRDRAWSYFMDFAEGEAVGRRVVRNADLAAARAKLPGELATELAKIHSVTPKSAPALFEDASRASHDPIDDMLAWLEGALGRVREPRPAIEIAFAWLCAHRPARATEVTLVHGDFRTGNFLVTPSGLSAVLDWEFAHWGAPAEDLAWISVRDWRFGELKKPIGGFGARRDFYEAYERASGRAVRADEIHYWEVAGNVRWAVGSILQGERYTSGKERDFELVAIGRRAIEMEYEAVRLIEQGPIT